MQRKVEMFIARLERRRVERLVQREIEAASPGVREDYLAALRRAA